MSSPWNSLEVTKLIIASLTPITVFVLGLWAKKLASKIDNSNWMSQNLIKRRIEGYDSVGEDLNTLLCYFTYIGHWKETSPKDILMLKRRIEQKLRILEPFFSSRVISSYEQLIEQCFIHQQGIGKDALIRANFEMHRQGFSGSWMSDWDKMFVPVDERTKRIEIRERMEALMSAIRHDLSLRSVEASVER